MDILRRKDGEITQLQKQVTDLTDALETQLESSRIDAEQSAQSEGRSRDFWTGRAAATVGPTHRELNDLLEQTRKALEAEKKAHLRTRDELNHAYSALEEQRLQAAQGGGAARLEPQSWRELRALREQTLDQAEQLKVFVTGCGVRDVFHIPVKLTFGMLHPIPGPVRREQSTAQGGTGAARAGRSVEPGPAGSVQAAWRCSPLPEEVSYTLFHSFGN